MAHDRDNGGQGQIGRAARSRIGRRLRLVFRSVVGDPIPDECIDLILALRRREREHGLAASSGALGTPAPTGGHQN